MDLPTIARGIGARTGFAPVPISMTFEVTHLCNLDCAYCDRHARKPREMTREQILTALGQLHELGMRHVSLDGGEPLTHRSIDEVVSFLMQRRVNVYMNSNGILVPRKLAVVRLLSKLKVSLDGPRECHDAIRGRGAWQKAVDGALAAREAGTRVELTCVVGQHNVERISDLLAFAERTGFAVVFQPARNSLFQNSGRDGSAFQLDAAATRSVFRRLEAAKLAGSPAIGNRWSSLRHFREFPNDVSLPCAAGYINATLDPEGILYHCGQVSRADSSANVVELGAAAAFERLMRGGCAQCWCARVVEENYAWGGRVTRMLPPLSAPASSPSHPVRRLRVVA
jgi:MoaA/NifB/PqqE/SkfB family radical SAM enzyme